jgi:hypothetical protein
VEQGCCGAREGFGIGIGSRSGLGRGWLLCLGWDHGIGSRLGCIWFDSRWDGTDDMSLRFF